MKARIPKSFLNLPKSERETIEKLKNEQVENEVNRYFAQLQKNWLKMSCMVLHNGCGMNAEECLLYLGNFGTAYRENARIATHDEQQKWLDAEMEKIFGTGGFPQKYLDRLEEL